MPNRIAIRIAIILIAVAVLWLWPVFASGDPSPLPHAAPAAAPVAIAPSPLAVSGAEYPGEVITSLSAFFEGITREQERLAAEEAARLEAAQRASRSGVAASRSGASYEGVGECTGFVIPDYIIERESRGNPHAVNATSGAFGCAQIMPMHWNPGGACAGLDRANIDDQRTCVDWLSEGGTRLSPWAATR